MFQDNVRFISFRYPGTQHDFEKKLVSHCKQSVWTYHLKKRREHGFSPWSGQNDKNIESQVETREKISRNANKNELQNICIHSIPNPKLKQIIKLIKNANENKKRHLI